MALATLGVLGVGAVASAPRLIRSQIEHAVHHRCPGCIVSMSSVRVAWGLDTVHIAGLRLATDPAHAGGGSVHVDQLTVRTTRSALLASAVLRRPIRIDAVSIRGLALSDASPHHLPEMTLEVGGVEAGPAAGWLRFETIHFISTATPNVRLEGRASTVRVAFEPRSLGSGVARIGSVVLDGARVTLIQSHESERWVEPPADAHTAPWWSRVPAVRVGGVAVHRSTFVYGDLNHGVTASVEFSDLEAHLGAVATRPGLAPAHADLYATGRSAGTGQARLGVHLDPVDGDVDTTIDLALRGQDLAGFESYTVPAEGMHLHGAIDDAFAVMHIEGANRVRGVLYGTYRGLDLNFTRSRAHGRIECAMLNLGVSLEIAPTDADRPPAGRTAVIDVARRPREPLMGYLWRSLSSTAVRVAHKT